MSSRGRGSTCAAPSRCSPTCRRARHGTLAHARSAHASPRLARRSADGTAEGRARARRHDDLRPRGAGQHRRREPRARLRRGYPARLRQGSRHDHPAHPGGRVGVRVGALSAPGGLRADPQPRVPVELLRERPYGDPDDPETLMQLLLFVEGMPIETLRAGIAWAWEDFAGYLGALEGRGVGPNVAAFIGHSAVRYRVMGRGAVERAATPEECAAMAALVREGMAAGAIGWSTSLSPTHFFGDGTPAPSRLPDEAELLALARALADLDRGVLEIAPRTTIGPPADKAEEQRSFAGRARASGKVVSWAPLLDNPFAPGSAQQIIAEAAELQARGVQVVPQVGCRPLEVRFDFTEPAFYLEQNPFWRPLMAKSRDERRRLFAD